MSTVNRRELMGHLWEKALHLKYHAKVTVPCSKLDHYELHTIREKNTSALDWTGRLLSFFTANAGKHLFHFHVLLFYRYTFAFN